MADLVALDGQPKRQLTEFAGALDRYGTRTQRAYFVDLHQTAVRSIMALSLQDKESVRLALCCEAGKRMAIDAEVPGFGRNGARTALTVGRQVRPW